MSYLDSLLEMVIEEDSIEEYKQRIKLIESIENKQIQYTFKNEKNIK